MYFAIAAVVVVILLVILYVYWDSIKSSVSSDTEGYFMEEEGMHGDFIDSEYPVGVDIADAITEKQLVNQARSESFEDNSFDDVAINFEDMAAQEALGGDYQTLQNDQAEWSGSITNTRPSLPVLEVQNDVNTRIGLSRTNYRDIPNLENQTTIPSLYNDQLIGTHDDNYNIMGRSVWSNV